MALCRCLQNHQNPQSMNTNLGPYVAYVFPMGYPQTAAICKHCDEPGVIWLHQNEVNDYNNGHRIFNLDSNSIRVLVDNSGIH